MRLVAWPCVASGCCRQHDWSKDQQDPWRMFKMTFAVYLMDRVNMCVIHSYIRESCQNVKSLQTTKHALYPNSSNIIPPSNEALQLLRILSTRSPEPIPQRLRPDDEQRTDIRQHIHGTRF